MFFLETFGALDLPLFEARQDIASGTSLSPVRQLMSGGAFRVRGLEQAPRAIQRITATGEYDPSTLIEMDALGRALYASRGTVEKLYRRMQGSQERHWCYAELVRVGAEQTPDRWLSPPLAPEFQMLSASWFGVQHGSAWRWGVGGTGDEWDSGVAWDQAAGDHFDIVATETSMEFEIENAGNYPVDNAILTISASLTDPIQDLIIFTDDASLHFNADIPAGQNLVIDAGARRITLNGASAYADLEIGAAHKLGGWLRLYPGTNTITLSYVTGVDGDFDIAFSDAHE